MICCHNPLYHVRYGERCHTHFPLYATSDIIFPLVPPDIAYNTITPHDSPLIPSASRHHPYGFPAISHTLKGGTLGENDLVVRTPPYSASYFALIIPVE